MEGGTSDAGCSGATPIHLTIYNYKAWCNVSVNGNAITTPTLGTTRPQSMCVADGVGIGATANGAAFEIGTPPLPFISGVTTASITDVGMMAKASLAPAATCVFICCPFSPGGTGCTGLVNPCP
jgi:hypothetical protein